MAARYCCLILPVVHCIHHLAGGDVANQPRERDQITGPGGCAWWPSVAIGRATKTRIGKGSSASRRMCRIDTGNKTFCRTIGRAQNRHHIVGMAPRKIVHRYPPKRERAKPATTPTKPTVIVTAKSRRQIDKDRRIRLLRERGY
jgi:hypothetical protein